MSYLREASKKHIVEHEFSGKNHFYKAKTLKDDVYQVSASFNCDCQFMSVEGKATGRICSHILAVINKISEKANVGLK